MNVKMTLFSIKPTCPITVSGQSSIPQNSWIITQKVKFKILKCN